MDDVSTILPSFLVLDDKSPRMPWSDREAPPDVLHWGQRKLLIAEVAFLMGVVAAEPETQQWTLVYAGAAPGTHLGWLMTLFPQVGCWSLWDERPTTFEVPDGVAAKVERYLLLKG